MHMGHSDVRRLKTLGVQVVIGGDNLPSPVGKGLTDLPNIRGASGPPGPGSGITVKIKSLNLIYAGINITFTTESHSTYSYEM